MTRRLVVHLAGGALVASFVGACSGSAPKPETAPGDSAAPPAESMTKADLCERVGHRICGRCDPDGEAECVSGYLQTCGDDAKTTRIRPTATELAACDKGLDAAECATLVGGELPPACTAGADW